MRDAIKVSFLVLALLGGATPAIEPEPEKTCSEIITEAVIYNEFGYPVGLKDIRTPPRKPRPAPASPVLPWGDGTVNADYGD